MPQLPQSDRMIEAEENLKRMLKDIEPFDQKPVTEEVSTAGTWRADDESHSELCFRADGSPY